MSVRLKENQSIVKSFSQKMIVPGIGVRRDRTP